MSTIKEVDGQEILEADDHCRELLFKCHSLMHKHGVSMQTAKSAQSYEFVPLVSFGHCSLTCQYALFWELAQPEPNPRAIFQCIRNCRDNFAEMVIFFREGEEAEYEDGSYSGPITNLLFAAYVANNPEVFDELLKERCWLSVTEGHVFRQLFAQLMSIIIQSDDRRWVAMILERNRLRDWANHPYLSKFHIHKIRSGQLLRLMSGSDHYYQSPPLEQYVDVWVSHLLWLANKLDSPGHEDDEHTRDYDQEMDTALLLVYQEKGLRKGVQLALIRAHSMLDGRSPSLYHHILTRRPLLIMEDLTGTAQRLLAAWPRNVLEKFSEYVQFDSSTVICAVRDNVGFVLDIMLDPVGDLDAFFCDDLHFLFTECIDRIYFHWFAHKRIGRKNDTWIQNIQYLLGRRIMNGRTTWPIGMFTERVLHVYPNNHFDRYGLSDKKTNMLQFVICRLLSIGATGTKRLQRTRDNIEHLVHFSPATSTDTKNVQVDIYRAVAEIICAYKLHCGIPLPSDEEMSVQTTVLPIDYTGPQQSTQEVISPEKRKEVRRSILEVGKSAANHGPYQLPFEVMDVIWEQYMRITVDNDRYALVERIKDKIWRHKDSIPRSRHGEFLEDRLRAIAGLPLKFSWEHLDHKTRFALMFDFGGEENKRKHEEDNEGDDEQPLGEPPEETTKVVKKAKT